MCSAAARCLFLALFSALLSACVPVKDASASRIACEPIEQRVPYPVKAGAPGELHAPIEAPPPTFVEPTDPNASSALTPEGEQRLLDLLDAYDARLDAWGAWADEPLPPPTKESP